MIHFLIQETQASPSFEKLLPALIKVLVVLILFIIGRNFDAKIRKEQIIRNWYFKVIIEPNLNIVDDFLKNSLLSIQTSIDLLIKGSTKKTMDEYVNLKSTEISKFSSIKREFEFNFVEIIRANHNNIANEIVVLLQKLEDDIGNTFDNDKLNKEDVELLEKKVRDFKTELFKVLYKPIIKPAGNKV